MIRNARILLTTDAVGGVWTYTLDLAGALTEAGATVRLVTLGPRPGVEQRREAARCGLDIVETDHALEWLAPDADAVRRAGEAVARLAASFGADLVHLNTPALAASTRFDQPVVAASHSCLATWWDAVRGTALPQRFAWCAALTRAGLAAADVAVVPTAAFGAATTRVHALGRVPRTVHNGRAVPHAAPDDGELDEVFAAGRLWDDGKNVRALDRAARRIAWPVRAAGGLADPHGETVGFDAIQTTGPWPGARVRAHLARQPLFVAPARYEPFGLAILEAAQAGCALVLNDIASLRELWDGAALFVAADEPDDLAGALQHLIEDRQRRRSLGRAARLRAGTYTLDAMASTMAGIYGGLVRRETLQDA